MIINKDFLHSQLFDTCFNHILSDIAKTAREICSSSFSQIHIPSIKKQWTQSSHHFYSTPCEKFTLLNEQTLLQGELIEVVNIDKDIRFNQQYFHIEDQRIKHYIGIPLIMGPDIIGVISVMDILPKALTDHQKRLLSLLANTIVTEVALRVKDEELKHISQLNEKLLASTSHVNSNRDDQLSHIQANTNVSKQYSEIGKELDEFTRILAHDLKSPLNAIKSLTDWIKDDDKENLSESSLKYFTMLTKSITRMDTLLEGLRSYSKVSRELEASKKAEFSNIVKESYSLLTIPDSFIIVNNTCEINIPNQSLKFVLSQLIDNGVKHHNKPSGVIDVTCKATLNEYVFTIKDDGPGIVKEFQTDIFKPFKQLKPKDEVEGSGLGLALIKKILTPYSAVIYVASNADEGSTFTVIWPRT